MQNAYRQALVLAAVAVGAPLRAAAAAPATPVGAVAKEMYEAGPVAARIVKGTSETVLLAVQLATQLAHSATPVTTGTIVADPQHPSSFTYSAEPRDRLLMAIGDGRDFAMKVGTLTGELHGTVRDFFAHPHELAYGFAMPGSVSVAVASHGQGEAAGWAVRGYLTSAGQKLVLDVRSACTRRAVNAGVRQAREAVRGSYGVGELTIAVDETSEEQQEVSGAAHTTRSVRHIASTAQEGGASYAMADVTVKKVFLNGKAVTLATWGETGGDLRRGNEVVGHVAVAKDAQFIRVRFVGADGVPPIDLETYKL